jgi:DNA-binding transcriptional LysR family regulator
MRMSWVTCPPFDGGPLMIELRQLRYLIAASEAGSFSRAAHELNIKQATLSRQIAYIEKRLGLLLFERLPGGAVLTPDGRHYLGVSRCIVGQFADINDWVRARRSGLQGRFSIGFYTSLSAGNLRSTLAEFTRQCPGVEIHHIERDRGDLLNGLNNGTIDAAVMLGEAAYKDLTKKSLWSERLLLAYGTDHVMEEGRPVRWPDLADEHFLLSGGDPGPELARVIAGKIARADQAPSIAFEDICRETLLNTVARGHYVTIVSEATAGNRLDGLRYREIDDRDGETRIGFSGYWREDNPNPVLRTFLDLITRRYAFPV